MKENNELKMKEFGLPEEVTQWLVARDARVTGDKKEWDIHYNKIGRAHV